jgi:peptidoglycan/LPS O-acetylase OafA/YrhL
MAQTAPLFCVASCEQIVLAGPVERRGDRLIETPAGSTFRFISVNTPNLHRIELPAVAGNADSVTIDQHVRVPTEGEIWDTLCAVQQMGGKVARTYVISAGNGEAFHVSGLAGGNLVFEERWFAALDTAIEIAGHLGIRLIIPLINVFHYKQWGSIATYSRWAGVGTDNFFTASSTVNLYRQLVEKLLNRNNTRTGQLYSHTLSILGWELGNEIFDHSALSDPVASATYQSTKDWRDLPPPPEAWTIMASSLIKSLAPNQLIIDGATVHSEYSADAVDVLGSTDYSDSIERVLQDATIAATNGKPFILKEFGITEAVRRQDSIGWIRSLSSLVLNGSLSGALYWSIRPHAEAGGFYHHYESQNITSLHWPGFEWGPAGDRSVFSVLTEGVSLLDCDDQAGFLDEHGYLCSDWVGIDCEVHSPDTTNYTSAGLTQVAAACPASCGICGQQGEKGVGYTDQYGLWLNSDILHAPCAPELFETFAPSYPPCLPFRGSTGAHTYILWIRAASSDATVDWYKAAHNITDHQYGMQAFASADTIWFERLLGSLDVYYPATTQYTLCITACNGDLTGVSSGSSCSDCSNEITLTMDLSQPLKSECAAIKTAAPADSEQYTILQQIRSVRQSAPLGSDWIVLGLLLVASVCSCGSVCIVCLRARQHTTNQSAKPGTAQKNKRGKSLSRMGALDALRLIATIHIILFHQREEFVCEDQIDFVDELGLSCAAWVGRSCESDESMTDYTESGITAVGISCEASCARCGPVGNEMVVNLSSWGGAELTALFMLSGFTLAIDYTNDRLQKAKVAPWSFWLRRFLRMYPCYCVSLILAIPFRYKYIGGQYALMFGCLNTWVDSLFYNAVNTPSWCVGAFLLCSAIFLPANKMLASADKSQRRYLAAVFFLATAWQALNKMGIKVLVVDNVLSWILFAAHVPTFLLGVVLGIEFNEAEGSSSPDAVQGRTRRTCQRALLLVVAFGGLLALFLCINLDTVTTKFISVWGSNGMLCPIFAIIIWCLAVGNKFTDVVLGNGVVQWFAQFSYCIYIFQHRPGPLGAYKCP